MGERVGVYFVHPRGFFDGVDGCVFVALRIIPRFVKMINESTLALIGLIVVIGLLASLPGAVALRSSQRNGRAAYAAAEAIQEDVSRQIARMSARVEVLERENGRLQERLDQAEAEIERLERDNARLGSAVRRLVTQVGALGKEPDIDPAVLQRLSRG